jgi:hypothetical protein
MSGLDGASPPAAFRTGEISRRPCPLCGDASAETVLSLAPTPLGDALRTTREAALGLTRYVLDVAMCPSCSHVHLPYVVEPDESYSNYHFRSADSPGLQSAMRDVAKGLWDQIESANALVVDIGSNDGTWLQFFRGQGARVIGVEPSPVHAADASARAIPTLNAYFTAEVAEQIVESEGHPTLVTANYVTANVPDLRSYFAAMRSIAGPSTEFSILTGYHPDQFNVNMFDFIYHEHVSYFTVIDFIRIADDNGFVITSARREWLKGGSLHVTFRRNTGSESHAQSAQRLSVIEGWQRVTQPSWFRALDTRLCRERERTHELLDAVEPTSLLGYGVSHSTTTLMFHFGLVERLTALIDDNAMRQGLFAPGSGLEVMPWAAGMHERFDAVAILAWQHEALIRDRIAAAGWRGPVIQMLPSATLVARAPA